MNLTIASISLALLISAIALLLLMDNFVLRFHQKKLKTQFEELGEGFDALKEENISNAKEMELFRQRQSMLVEKIKRIQEELEATEDGPQVSLIFIYQVGQPYDLSELKSIKNNLGAPFHLDIWDRQ